MRQATLLMFALAGLLVVGLVIVNNATRTEAGAGSMQAMYFDMDITGNDATTLSSVETCARINENDIQDADETGVDSIQFDITAVNIPASHPMVAFDYRFNYNEDVLTVAARDSVFLLDHLNQSGGADIFQLPDPVPDTNGDNRFASGALDIGDLQVNPDIYESGSGVLQRVTIRSDTGAAPGQYGIEFDFVGGNRRAVHIDPANEAWFADNVNSAVIAIDQECGATTPATPPPTPSPTLPGQTPTPSPTPTVPPSATPTATPAPGTETPSPTPCKVDCPTETPTPPATPTATPTGGAQVQKGDLQCDNDIDSVDALMALRHIASLPVTQNPGCPPIGSQLARLSAGSNIWGDINCNNKVEAVDPLFILRHVASLPVSLPGGCDAIGTPVSIN